LVRVHDPSQLRQLPGHTVLTRDLYYETPVKSTFGPPHGNVTETQTLEPMPWGFVARVRARVPNVPFGGRFHTDVQLVAWPLEPGTCCLSITSEVGQGL